ncbi:hypothetical protein M407DRAFT_246264 [Tulasnella calospora MUT 4182]|uniref:YCII-related domain-containing protein n=1 Tax=Tulasnella calospora MUT 4182 TaxID=1051891 RepID=A0A0C3Q6W7_9AGAM|nr:hypothetical protein M407DRAFT_246264 [Tulasnella calospora MUT 4182]
MSTSSRVQKYLFLVYAPDCTDQGTFEKRLEVREKHLQEALPALEPQADVSMKVGGAVLTPESITGEGPRTMVGSMLLFEAESIEAVRKRVESDIYYTSGVWDPNKLVILPYVKALGTTNIS